MTDGNNRSFVAVLADLSGLDRVRYAAGMALLDAAMKVSNWLWPPELVEAAEREGLEHALEFERQTDSDGGNVYVFQTEDGRRLELSPGDTVSHLQNRL